MSQVVFLRAANVGGHNTFRPSAVAREVGAVSIGAAGTFVLPSSVEVEALRAALPFEAQLFTCPGHELLALAASDPFGAMDDGVRPFLTVMEAAPASSVTLPLERPEGAPWEVRIVALEGRYAMSLWLRRGERILYPNAVVERVLRVAATTRSWNTVGAIARALEEIA